MLETIQQIFTETFLGIPLSRFAMGIGLLLLALIVKRLVGQFFVRILFPLAARSSSQYDDAALNALRKPAELMVLTGGLALALQLLGLPGEPVDLAAFGDAVVKILITASLAWALFNLVDVVDLFLRRWSSRTETDLDDHLAPFIRKLLRVFIVAMAVLMVIQNLGYSVSGLLASLGIGGLAVALAARDTLANVFGSIMILVDRPFGLGDWIKTGDLEGTVEEVGFRSTKIRTFAKTLISVPNSVIANQAINNFSRMPKRRIKLTVGVTYSTTPEQMRRAVEEIRQMLREHPAIDQDFFLVNFTDFAPSSLDIMVYCFTRTTVWAEYLDARQDVCLKIMEILEGLGLEIAFPTRSIYIENKAGDMEPAEAESR